MVAAIRRYTEGNPLFVGEVAQLLAAEGRLERIGDHDAELSLWRIAAGFPCAQARLPSHYNY